MQYRLVGGSPGHGGHPSLLPVFERVAPIAGFLKMVRQEFRVTLDRLGDKTVIFGVISMADPEPESPETVAARIRAALAHIPAERLIPAPDCGMKYIPREVALAKLKALAEGAALVRRELTGG